MSEMTLLQFSRMNWMLCSSEAGSVSSLSTLSTVLRTCSSPDTAWTSLRVPRHSRINVTDLEEALRTVAIRATQVAVVENGSMMMSIDGGRPKLLACQQRWALSKQPNAPTPNPAAEAL